MKLNMGDLSCPVVAIPLVICCVLAGWFLSSMVTLADQPTKQVIFTENAPKPIGPYSQAIQAGQIVFLSGQIGIDPKTGNVSSTVSGQTEQVMKNLEAILVESGMDFSHVVQTRIYLINLTDFSTVNEIYGKYMGSDYPARVTVQVSGLPKGAMVEIEMIAYI